MKHIASFKGAPLPVLFDEAQCIKNFLTCIYQKRRFTAASRHFRDCVCSEPSFFFYIFRQNSVPPQIMQPGGTPRSLLYAGYLGLIPNLFSPGWPSVASNTIRMI